MAKKGPVAESITDSNEVVQNEAYEVVQNVPVPARKPWTDKYPLDQLNEGAALFIQTDKPRLVDRRVRTQAKAAGIAVTVRAGNIKTLGGTIDAPGIGVWVKAPKQVEG